MRPHTFARALATVSGLTGLSRVLGFVRDQMFAAVIGPGLLLDAWFAAFTLPNVFRRTFAEGAMSAAYVPLLKGYQCPLLRSSLNEENTIWSLKNVAPKSDSVEFPV